MIPKGMGNLMKQAQKVQQEMMKMQEELGAREVSAQAGGGMVEAVVNGKGQLLRLKLEPEVVDPRGCGDVVRSGCGGRWRGPAPGTGYDAE